jgi:diadenylate cyclase
LGNIFHDTNLLLRVFTNILDISLVLLVIYQIFRLMRGTKGVFFLNASIILIVIYAVSRYLNLVLFTQLLNLLGMALIVSLPIIFQSELKRAIEVFGGKNPFIKWLVRPPAVVIASIDIIVDAAAALAKNRIGALIVLQQTNPLPEVHQSGSNIDAKLTQIMIEQIFYPNSPLHDGALVVSNNRIQAAGCFLPLDNELSLPQELGSRHRAALSLSSQSDALVVIISEETGKISLACHGVLQKYTPEQLKLKLQELLNPEEEIPHPIQSKGDEKFEA